LPQDGVANVLEDHINAAALCEAHDLLFEVGPAVIDADVRT
jgi:hypothetical protein